jgi:hypothetical protein
VRGSEFIIIIIIIIIIISEETRRFTVLEIPQAAPAHPSGALG